jgi:hypothetical protein
VLHTRHSHRALPRLRQDGPEGAKAAGAIASNQEWRESRPAQFAVKEEKLVEAVREVLARHDVTWNN